MTSSNFFSFVSSRSITVLYPLYHPFVFQVFCILFQYLPSRLHREYCNLHLILRWEIINPWQSSPIFVSTWRSFLVKNFSQSLSNLYYIDLLYVVLLHLFLLPTQSQLQCISSQNPTFFFYVLSCSQVNKHQYIR